MRQHPSGARRWRSALTAAVCASAVALVPTSSAPVANAAGENCLNQGNYFAGVGSPRTSAIFGSRAEIQRDDPQLCSAAGGSPSDSSAWAMVTAQIVGHPNQDHYAQVGYAKVGARSGEPVQGLHVFAQYTRACKPDCAGANFVNVYAPAPGGTELYTNVLRSSDNRIHMLADGVEIARTGYDPQGDWQPEWQAQFAGETFHPQSDVVGTVNNRTRFFRLQRFESNGDINFIQNFPLQVERFYS